MTMENIIIGINYEMLKMIGRGLFNMYCLRFKVLTSVKMSMVVFWVVTPRRWRQYVPLKRRCPPPSPNGVTTHKTTGPGFDFQPRC
jgi:hypothetical protein